MTKVKICGLQTAEHVTAAVEAGADAVGFVFAPSSRLIPVAKAKELAANIPAHVLKIGVFVNASHEKLQYAYETVPLDYIQYHGDEDADFISAIGLPSIKAISVHSEDDVQRAVAYNVDYLLFDAPGTAFRGGSGHSFDWSLLDKAGIDKHRVILAGGLHSGNVEEAIQQVQPFMVDVSSGVEIDKQKDAGLIQSFLETVKRRGDNI